MPWIDVIAQSELKPGNRHSTLLNERPILIFNLENKFYAIENLCTHQSLPLTEGELHGDTIECPFHGAQFCIRSGKAITPPAYHNLPTFPVRVRNGKIQIEVEA